ncbi:MAG: hypothetical protein A3F53_01050 [Candidatus Zambryskibacteria bacterium RIFCSPHIGHO2_12_FULL_48_10]|uniref:DUF4325 domain-containing protein n=1 Tax=Candidatus Zambryskibacteria bacterium RIFCSPHIGHO2_01_FULL_46_25 TaxID=1802738 RepID=A0A1G2SYZ7_9BACT|nr:MAG: hypothetical protein UX71_C0002G0203 [Parcubacteria group bacterium GW2011_GWA1_47_10]OHA90082.1 MAG: hypothetical protein A2838_00385 [Candidatus Zambryskibacteria bacterium RIFCSPHIGHO2_01_FULL_46_25]OHB00866.1 MAG: hypothetical protein A3F53_01050 [Candidatus Zambryskibacteria bacterium RIFCSPHIGHO2_12_FULL_48_10]OHB06543.1 MAG: hypothetical protein A3A31_02870 [Candidatus Zambryskibacteria bacterium RIFCSPLOWO2_01_FULL_48_25]
MITINIKQEAGEFAENKDIARDFRINTILPTLNKGEEIIIDFTGVDGATQSFIHALISEPFRKHGDNVLDKVKFKNCNKTVQKVITIVTEYMQEAE